MIFVVIAATQLNVPKLSHCHWRSIQQWNNDRPISYFVAKLKGQSALAPARVRHQLSYRLASTGKN
jgi:hypothetical protein